MKLSDDWCGSSTSEFCQLWHSCTCAIHLIKGISVSRPLIAHPAIDDVQLLTCLIRQCKDSGSGKDPQAQRPRVQFGSVNLLHSICAHCTIFSHGGKEIRPKQSFTMYDDDFWLYDIDDSGCSQFCWPDGIEMVLRNGRIGLFPTGDILLDNILQKRRIGSTTCHILRSIKYCQRILRTFIIWRFPDQAHITCGMAIPFHR